MGSFEEEVFGDEWTKNTTDKSRVSMLKTKGLANETYYGKLTKIWDSVANHRPFRVCKCGKCECNLEAIQEQAREEDKVHQFIFRLDGTFFSKGSV